MKKIVILSTDTPHHRYFINTLTKDVPITGCIFEKESVRPPFATGPLFEDQEAAFEHEHFFKNLSSSLTTSISEVKQINSTESLIKLRALSPDFGIVFGTRKLSPEIIAVFRDGLINVHRGISQEYRGLDSDLWAIYHDDYANLGTTIHQIEPNLDTGKIIYQEHLELKQGMKTHQIRFYTTIIATRLVKNAVDDYLNNRLSPYPQPHKGRYYSFMPLELKKIITEKFNRYCEGLHATASARLSN